MSDLSAKDIVCLHIFKTVMHNIIFFGLEK